MRLVAVQRTRCPRGTVTPPFSPSLKPGITLPAASTTLQVQLPVDPGIRTAFWVEVLDVVQVSARLGQRIGDVRT